MLLYYITDRKSLAGTDAQQRSRLLVRIGEAARAGVDYIQLREKDLAARDLERLARDAVRAVRENSATAKLLINGRADVALACGADGVHLPAGELDASEVRALWMQASDRAPVIAVSAHTIEEVRAAADQGADFAVLAPIFEKAHTDVLGIGIDVLRAACADRRRPCKPVSPSLCDIGAGRSHSGERRGVPCRRRRWGRGDSLVSERRCRGDGAPPARVGTHSFLILSRKKERRAKSPFRNSFPLLDPQNDVGLLPIVELAQGFRVTLFALALRIDLIIHIGRELRKAIGTVIAGDNGFHRQRLHVL